MGATSQNGDEDELYDDADVSEDDFAEFDIDDDEEHASQKVRRILFWQVSELGRDLIFKIYRTSQI